MLMMTFEWSGIEWGETEDSGGLTFALLVALAPAVLAPRRSKSTLLFTFSSFTILKRTFGLLRSFFISLCCCASFLPSPPPPFSFPPSPSPLSLPARTSGREGRLLNPKRDRDDTFFPRVHGTARPPNFSFILQYSIFSLLFTITSRCAGWCCLSPPHKQTRCPGNSRSTSQRNGSDTDPVSAVRCSSLSSGPFSTNLSKSEYKTHEQTTFKS